MSCRVMLMVHQLRVGLSLAEYRVLMVLAEHAGADGADAWPSIATIQTEGEMGERTVQRSLSTLIARGLVSVESDRKGGRGRSTRYRVNIPAPDDATCAAKRVPDVRCITVPTRPERVPDLPIKGATLAPEPVLEPIQDSSLRSESPLKPPIRFAWHDDADDAAPPADAPAPVAEPEPVPIAFRDPPAPPPVRALVPMLAERQVELLPPEPEPTDPRPLAPGRGLIPARGKPHRGVVRALRSQALAAAGADGFETWWDAYPRKVGKGEARKAYIKALAKGVSPAELLQAVQRQAWDERPQYRPHPSTWLNQERWADDPTAAAPGRGDALRRVADRWGLAGFDEMERLRQELMTPEELEQERAAGRLALEGSR